MESNNGLVDPLNLELIARQLKDVAVVLPEYAGHFDLKRMLACLAQFMANSGELAVTWHNLFVDENYRAGAGWEKLQELYWKNLCTSNELADLSHLVLHVYEAYFAKECRPILAAFFIKLIEATGLVEAISDELLEMGNPWIQSNFMVWGQPLSLSPELHQYYTKALCGETTQESESEFFSRNCNKYGLPVLFMDVDETIADGVTVTTDIDSVKSELDVLTRVRERLRFMKIYLERGTQDWYEHMEHLDRKIKRFEGYYSSALKKKEAFDDLLSSLDGTCEEQNETLAKIFRGAALSKLAFGVRSVDAQTAVFAEPTFAAGRAGCGSNEPPAVAAESTTTSAAVRAVSTEPPAVAASTTSDAERTGLCDESSIDDDDCEILYVGATPSPLCDENDDQVVEEEENESEYSEEEVVDDGVADIEEVRSDSDHENDKNDTVTVCGKTSEKDKTSSMEVENDSEDLLLGRVADEAEVRLTGSGAIGKFPGYFAGSSMEGKQAGDSTGCLFDSFLSIENLGCADLPELSRKRRLSCSSPVSRKSLLAENDVASVSKPSTETPTSKTPPAVSKTDYAETPTSSKTKDFT